MYVLFRKKHIFIFSRLEKQKGPLWCIDTRFLHGKFAVRASRHSREGRSHCNKAAAAMQ